LHGHDCPSERRPAAAPAHRRAALSCQRGE
jgi:hypothetical protein